MKNKIEDMTHEEIIKLTHEELEHLVKYKCAEEGVRLVVRPIEPEKVTIPKELAKPYYSVAGFVFKALCDAEAVAAQLNMKQLFKSDYNWQVGSEYRYLKPLYDHEQLEALTVTPINLFDIETVHEHKAKMMQYKIENEAFEKALKVYENEVKAIENIRADVYEVYNKHVDEENKLRNNVERFKDYIQIANGDIEVAKAFYKKAYAPTDEFLEKVVSKC